MTILAIVKLLLGFADGLMGFLNAQQQQEAGKALANAANLQRALDEIRRADAARSDVERRRAADPNWLPDNDPNRID